MKIGIITWFNHENYGTKLQAYALQRYLRNKENNVTLLNFSLDDSAPKTKSHNSIFTKIYLRIGYYKLKFYMEKYSAELNKKSVEFTKFTESYCDISEQINTDSEYISLCNTYDALIFGSDQIWNPNWFHKFYYADFQQINTRRIAYAPSFGVSQIPFSMYEDYRRVLNRFSKLGVREKSGVSMIEEISGKKSELVCDPTFLLSANEWMKLEINPGIKKDKYILCYFLTDNFNHWIAVKKYARMKKMKIITIPVGGHSYSKGETIITDATIQNFIYLIHNADVVLTDSFHGSVFSLIFEKQFYVFERHNNKSKQSQNSRILNLLSEMNCNQNLVKHNSKQINEYYLDYSIINPCKSKIIEESKKYIDYSISEKGDK